MTQFQQPFGYGYPYQQPVQQPPQPAMTSWLTQEEIDKIKTNNTFSLSVTEEEMIRGVCNHTNLQGNPTIKVDEINNTCTCLQCGEVFRIGNELTKEEVQNSVDNILDILQTTKMMYVNITPQVAREYYQIIPFLKKLPKLYEIAAADYKRYDQSSTFLGQQGNQNVFAIYGALTTPSYNYYQQPQQVMGQQMMGQPAPAAPMGMANNMMGGMPQPMGGNPFYGQPSYPNQMMGGQPQMAPQQQGFAFSPVGAASPTPTSFPTPQPVSAAPTVPQHPTQQPLVSPTPEETAAKVDKVDVKSKKK